MTRRAHWSGYGSSLTLRVLTDEVQRRGYDPARLLADVGLTLRDAKNPLGHVARDTIFAFSAHAARVLGDPAFHVHASANAEIGAFGVMDFIVTMAPTIGLGIARVSLGYAVINSGVRLEPVVGTRDAYVRLNAITEPHPHAVDVETLAVVASARIRSATGDRAGAVRVTRTGPEPVYRAELERLVGCPVEYEYPEDRIVFTRATWDSRPVSAHPAFASLLSLVTEPVMTRLARPPLTASIERVIDEHLSEQRLSASHVADILGLSLRTLHRRLASEAHHFGELLDRTRERVARAELERGTPIADIALRVGFSDTPAFTRAYRRWTGAPPSAHRPRR